MTTKRTGRPIKEIAAASRANPARAGAMARAKVRVDAALRVHHFYFFNLTGFILDDAGCHAITEALEMLRDLRKDATVVKVRGKVPPAYRPEEISVRIDINGVAKLS